MERQQYYHESDKQREQIVKFVHLVIGAITALFVSKTSFLYLYEGDETLKKGDWTSISAQMIAIICTTNFREKDYYSNLFNDQIMIMYIVMSIYLLAN